MKIIIIDPTGLVVAGPIEADGPAAAQAIYGAVGLFAGCTVQAQQSIESQGWTTSDNGVTFTPPAN